MTWTGKVLNKQLLTPVLKIRFVDVYNYNFDNQYYIAIED